MKIKSVIAGIVAAAAMSCAAVCACADEANAEILLAAVPSDKATARGAETETAEAKSHSGTGIEGVAAVFGTIVLAGAAVVISRKKA
ncbi:MAG: hypothetical protein ACI4JS_08520 [Oscillospiraceae bacterium]